MKRFSILNLLLVTVVIALALLHMITNWKHAAEVQTLENRIVSLQERFQNMAMEDLHSDFPNGDYSQEELIERLEKFMPKE